MEEIKCEVCGNIRTKEFCIFCNNYHAPEECEGEDCFICQQIVMIKEGLLPKGDEHIINFKHIV